MQDKSEAVELHHLMKLIRQCLKQRGQVVIQDDSFRYPQQSTVAVARCLYLDNWRRCHAESYG